MKTLSQIYNELPTNTDCITWLEDLFWVKSPQCPYCESHKSKALLNESRYRCNNCKTTFSVTAKTIFHKTKVDLQVWFYVMLLIEKENISYRSLAVKAGVSINTASYMVRRINQFNKANILILNKLKTNK